jgi:hypothetical protein
MESKFNGTQPLQSNGSETEKACHMPEAPASGGAHKGDVLKMPPRSSTALYAAGGSEKQRGNREKRAVD